MEGLAFPTSVVPSKEANFEARFNFEDRSRLHECTLKAKCTLGLNWIYMMEFGIPLLEDIDETFESLDIDIEGMIVDK